MIYLDHAATTHPLPCALAAFRRVTEESWANPNSEHGPGERARTELETATRKMRRLLGLAPGDKLIFTSGASEGAALAMKSLTENCEMVAVSNIDHHCVTQYPLPPAEHGKPHEYGIAQMYYQNETGEYIDAPNMEQHKMLWASDVTAGVGHVNFAFKNHLTMTYAFGGAHKFGGLPGAGFLIAKKGAPLSQMIYGAEQRGGTPTVALIAAMTEALEWQTEHMDENLDKLISMKEYLRDRLLKIENSQLNTARQSLPHILNISFSGIDNKSLQLMLSARGVMIGTGAACTNGDHAPSHVLMEMFHDEARARSAIRLSLSPENTMEECEKAAEQIEESVRHLRYIS